MRDIIKNPLFRIAGILAILYYGLFHDKSDPDSLRNRLSAEKVKSNIGEITSQSIHIIDNVKKAQEISKSLANPESTNNTNEK
jgi:hypothetical protein